MVKYTDWLFTIPVGIQFGGLGEHEPIIVALFLPVLSCRD